jgi:hypothetical protein
VAEAGSEAEAGVGLLQTANARGHQNGLLMSFTAAMNGQGPGGGQHTDDWVYRRGGADGVRSPRWNGPSKVPQERTLHILLFKGSTSSTHAFMAIHPLFFFIPQRTFCKRGNSLCFVALVLKLSCSSYEFMSLIITVTRILPRSTHSLYENYIPVPALLIRVLSVER